MALEDTGAEICPAETTLSSETDAAEPRARGGEPINGGGCSGMRSDERRKCADFAASPLRRLGERVGVPLDRVPVGLPGDAGASCADKRGFSRVSARSRETEPSGKRAGGAGLAVWRVGLPSGKSAGG